MKVSRLLVRSSLASTLVVGCVVAAVAAESPASASCISTEGSKYTVITNYGKVLDGKGNPAIYHNGSGSSSAFTLTQSETGTVQWAVNGSVTATAGFSFSVVSAGVSATVGGSYTSSKATSQTVSATINVPSNYYGILQGGVFRQYTYGKYVTNDGYCHITTQYIKPKVVFPSQGSSSAVNSTGNVPWDQQ